MYLKMRNLFICLFLILGYCSISRAEIRKNTDMSMVAGTASHAIVNVVLASTSSTAGVSKGVLRIITNNSPYTIYKVNASYSVGITTSTGTPIYAYEHYVENKWLDELWFAADPSAGSVTCDVRVEAQVWK